MNITTLITGGGFVLRPRTDVPAGCAPGTSAALVVADRASLDVASTHHLPSITG